MLDGVHETVGIRAGDGQAGTGAGGGAGGRAGIASGIGSRAAGLDRMARVRAGQPEGGRRVWRMGATSIAGSRSCAPPGKVTQHRRQAEGIVAPAECDTPTDFRDT